ncbi:alpha/beta hydrolase [Nocardioides limicola]|uniref:alpha/beta hydrolase n=1 Tax=Nocardioides limicola TaxID=2803368 RepID=UPI00193B9DA2|nr:alpha/beta hydrolase [Nocardioides sp. DJM-14]
MGFLARQVAIAALTANAVRPRTSLRAGIGSFAAGWPAGELAPQLAAVTAADALLHLPRAREHKLGLALAAASTATLATVIKQSLDVGTVLDDALAHVEGPLSNAAPLPWRTIARPFKLRDATLRVVRDVQYAPWGGRGQLDVYLPPEPVQGAPVLLQVHGGAWLIGAKHQQGLPLIRQMATKGWVCVAINYRLAGRDPFPAQVIDVKRAITWIKENIADFGGDPGYLAITGGSAGGHLSSLTALTANDPAYQPDFEDLDTSVDVAVPHYGVYDLAGATGLPSMLAMRDRFLAPRVMHRSYEEAPELFEAASPILRVSPDAPDFFVLHGARDSLVPVSQARLFVEELRRVSRRDVTYAELPGAQHAYEIFNSIRSVHVTRAVDRYLSQHWAKRRAKLTVAA